MSQSRFEGGPAPDRDVEFERKRSELSEKLTTIAGKIRSDDQAVVREGLYSITIAMPTFVEYSLEERVRGILAEVPEGYAPELREALLMAMNSSLDMLGSFRGGRSTLNLLSWCVDRIDKPDFVAYAQERTKKKKKFDALLVLALTQTAEIFAHINRTNSAVGVLDTLEKLMVGYTIQRGENDPRAFTLAAVVKRIGDISGAYAAVTLLQERSTPFDGDGHVVKEYVHWLSDAETLLNAGMTYEEALALYNTKVDPYTNKGKKLLFESSWRTALAARNSEEEGEVREAA